VSQLPTTVLGRTGLVVSRLGYGTGSSDLSRRPADTLGDLFQEVVDSGINLFDTAPDYGIAEELIGTYLSHRRSEILLATKCGCVSGPGPTIGLLPQHDYTPKHIRAGVEESLRRMKTDYLDILQVHISPTRQLLEASGTIEAMQSLRDNGKVRYLGMSGTLPNITDHIAMGVFDTFQIPYSALQREHEDVISEAAAAGSGTVIRGGVARGAPVVTDERLGRLPGELSRPLQEGRDGWQAAHLDGLLDGESPMTFMLRFTLSHPGVNTTIVGTTRPEHLIANLAAAQRGPLPGDIYAEAKRRLNGADGH
jgi:aryl-alcohol dehydrogenase-like predicted oxidoreductase